MLSNFLFRISCWLILLEITSSSSNDLDLTSLSPKRGFSILAASSSDSFAFSVSRAGDVNNDGFDDFIISARQAITTGTTNAGVVYVIFGNKNGLSDIDLANGLSSSQGFIINGINAGDSFGWSVCGAGDYNDDDIADIAIGAAFTYYSPASLTYAGTAYMLFGKQNWAPSVINIAAVTPPNDGFKVEGSFLGGYFGHSVSLVSDINGDDVDDFIIGAPGENSLSGIAYVIYGHKTGDPAVDLKLYPPSDLTISRGFRITSPTATSYFGVKVSSAGDFNGDGINDILIGAPDIYQANAGRAYVIFGKKAGFASDINTASGFTLAQGVLIKGTNVGDYFGIVVSDAGDFNGDGIADVIIGSQAASPSGRTGSGAAYIIFGSKTSLSNIDLAQGLTISQGIKIEGGTTDFNLGMGVSKAGDINGDGIDDVIVGAYATDGVESRVYVIYGRKVNITDIDLENGLDDTQGYLIKLSGAQKLGAVMGYAGDANGDGVSDIILGAQISGTPPAGTVGKVFVVYGVGIPSTDPGIVGPVATAKDTDPGLAGPVATAQGTATQVARGFTLALTLINFSNAGAVLFTALAEILHYMKYMSITYPTRLQHILDEPDPEFISIPYLSSAPDQIEDKATRYVIPENFEKYDIHSSFLVNCWSPVITLAIIIGSILIVYLCEFIFGNSKPIGSRIKKLREALKWNYLLAIFTGYFGDMGFYTAFEMTTVQFNSLFEAVSFSICTLLNAFIIGVSIKLVLIVYELIKESKVAQQTGNSKSFKDLQEKLQDYQVVFEAFHSKSFIQQAYLLIFSLRLYLFNCIIIYLYEYPLAQAILINIQGLLFIGYLALTRPMKDRKDLIGSFAQEIILQVVHACVLGLAIIDGTDSADTTSFVILGDIIIVCNVIFVVIGLIYIAISMILLIRDIIQFIRRKVNKPKTERGLNISSHRIVSSIRNSSFTADQSMLMMINNPNRSPDSGISYRSNHNIHQAEFFDDSPLSISSSAKKKSRVVLDLGIKSRLRREQSKPRYDSEDMLPPLVPLGNLEPTARRRRRNEDTGPFKRR